jgi:putative hydrolase of the HAD superfamily
MSAIRNVVFDLGGVLFEWNPDAILARCYDDGARRATVKRAVFEHRDWLALDRGTLSEAQAVDSFSRRTGLPSEDMQALMESVRHSLLPIADSVELLQQLAARAVPLYALSNMARPTFEFLHARYPFWSAFSGMVISWQVGFIKPEAAIFEHLLGSYRLDPAATLFIDDVAANIEAARALGMQALQFRGAADLRARLPRHLQF